MSLLSLVMMSVVMSILYILKKSVHVKTKLKVDCCIINVICDLDTIQLLLEESEKRAYNGQIIGWP